MNIHSAEAGGKSSKKKFIIEIEKRLIYLSVIPAQPLPLECEA